MEYSNAGHMPAVLAGPSGTTLLSDARSVLLAVRRDEARPQISCRLTSGSTLLVFTDGLVERKHESIDDGVARAAKVLVETRTLPLDAVADAVLRRLAPPSGYDDDVAMVIYRHQQAALRIETHAIANELAVIRHRLADWLRGADIPRELIDDIVLVVNEACTNCVEHAYRGHGVGTTLVEVETVDGEIRARVSDRGSWRPPAANGRHHLPGTDVARRSR